MRQPLRILSVEDDPQDTELIRDLLEAEDVVCEITRVDTEPAFLAALHQNQFDVILADYTLPRFDGLSALQLATKVRPEVPFIFVSGTLGEEVAVEALKIGASDYVLKTRLSRLLPSLIRAQREAEERAERKHAGEKLRRSEAYLAEAQKLSHTGSFGWDVSTGEVYWSPETFRIFEYDPALKVTVDLIDQRIHPADRLAVQQRMERATAERTEFDFEHRLLMPDGSIKHLRVIGRPSIDGWSALEFVGAVTDITERRRSEEALRRTESYLAEAQRLTHTGSWAWQIERRDAVHLSDEWYRVYEFDPAQGKPVWEQRLQRVLPSDRAHWLGAIEQAIRDKSGYDVEFRILVPGGAIKWIHTVGHPVLDASGELLQFVGTSTDITERKRSEEALRRSEGYLAEAQRLSQTGSWAWNVHTRDTFWSQEMFRILGYDPEKTTPSLSRFLERVHPDDRSMMEHRAQADVAQSEPVDSVDYRIVLPDSTVKHLHSVSHSVFQDSGELAEIIGTTIDITEQRNARIALEEAFQEIKVLKDQLHKENIALREEIDKISMFEEIVGSSEPLRQALEQVARVASSDSTVLIFGETGTGKEMIARAIHRRSRRSARAFIRVNCAAIPPTLIASELFGHEKGAFTGATQRRLGRFELADGGTIFLDEVGELPADAQSSLLRVLQEREFERVGSTHSISVDVRILSATNRDLKAAVAAGTFRQDLFYRLNVFPIQVPSLRERADDIPLLLEYLIERYAKKSGKRIRNIEKRTLDLFQAYQWPGNIRELQNVVERAVVLCDGDTFSVDETWLKREAPSEPAAPQPPAKGLGRLLPDQEKEMIEAALAQSRGRVSGPAGAAARLGIPRQTLEYRIAALGIKKRDFKSL
jgi:PAS domain S-box-containing protein